MAIAAESVTEVCRRARAASLILPGVASADKDAALTVLARLLRERTAEILDANRVDLDAGRDAGLDDALIDRLRLDPDRIEAMAVGVEAVRALDDPIGELLERRTLESGIEMEHRRVPIGVVAIVYEARPNVTIDAAVLCLKSGNACVLRGSSSAAHSNAVLAGIAAQAAQESGLPAGSVSLVAGGGRDELAELATQEGVVDLIIPRGGEGLKNALKGVATVPVIYAASGNCHVFVDASGDLDDAVAITVNAKTHRPGVCNAAESLLVHSAVAGEFVPRVLAALRDEGVELRVDARARSLAGAEFDGVLVDASDEDFASEFLSLTIAVAIVDSVDEAIDHVNRYGSGHSEAIVTADMSSALAFERGVDAACVYVNASTRFTDGGEFGMGAEIGNSTQKLHARGPIGLRELCTTKYVVTGDGHVRS